MAVITVGHEDDVLPGGALRVIAEGTPIAIFNVHGELYAIADTCTHEEFSLADGEMVDDYTVVAVKPQPQVASLLRDVVASGQRGSIHSRAMAPNAATSRTNSLDDVNQGPLVASSPI